MEINRAVYVPEQKFILTFLSIFLTIVQYSFMSGCVIGIQHCIMYNTLYKYTSLYSNSSSKRLLIFENGKIVIHKQGIKQVAMVSRIQRLRELQEELHDLRGAVDGVRKQVSGVAACLKQLNPQPLLSKFSRPVRNKDYKRIINMASFLREKITSFNASTSSEKYLEFPENRMDRQLISDAK